MRALCSDLPVVCQSTCARCPCFSGLWFILDDSAFPSCGDSSCTCWTGTDLSACSHTLNARLSCCKRFARMQTAEQFSRTRLSCHGWSGFIRLFEIRRRLRRRPFWEPHVNPPGWPRVTDQIETALFLCWYCKGHWCLISASGSLRRPA